MFNNEYEDCLLEAEVDLTIGDDYKDATSEDSLLEAVLDFEEACNKEEDEDLLDEEDIDLLDDED